MDSLALFGISVFFSFAMWSIVAARYLWPWLNALHRPDALQPLLLLHAGRFIGLSFLVPGVVSPELPAAFAQPAAYGDLVASVMALCALLALRTAAGTALVWIFNIWGTADLLYAFYQGLFGARIEPGHLGAAYFIPTVIVPLLLVTHIVIFRLLVRRDASEAHRSQEMP
jgi:hypothetical protein